MMKVLAKVLVPVRVSIRRVRYSTYASTPMKSFVTIRDSRLSCSRKRAQAISRNS